MRLRGLIAVARASIPRPARRALAFVGLAAVTAGIAAVSRGQSSSIALVARGKPAASIVIPVGAAAADRRAAGILRSAVSAMTGVDLPVLEKRAPSAKNEVVIGFGRSSLPRALSRGAARLTHDGFLVATAGGNLFVVSGGHKGSIYGVVYVLESLGCRRYSPAAAVFPRRDGLAVGRMSHAENPVNDLRIVYGDFSRDPDYQDWMRLDVIDDVFGKDYYVHTFNELVPRGEYFAAHPEYFAWMNGKRVPDQLCPSHPDVLEIAVARLKAAMAAQPEKRVWSVSQNDNSSYCLCDRCRKIIEEEGCASGPIVRFVNAVAARFPDRIISTLAYQYSRRPPGITRPAPNVQVMLCTIELNRSLPIASDPASASFVQDIADWARVTRNIYLWDYVVNFSHHVSPFPNLHVLQPNLQFFARHGVHQHFQQANASPGHEFSELKSYLLARLLWNPQADRMAVMKEFLDGYYGAAGPWVGKYIAALERALTESGARLDIYEPPVAHADTYLSRDRVAEYNGLFDRAEGAVRDDPVMLERVKMARLPLQYAMLEIGKNDMFGPRGFYLQRDGRSEARPEMARLLEGFYRTCERNGVRTLSEAGLTPRQYYESALPFSHDSEPVKKSATRYKP